MYGWSSAAMQACHHEQAVSCMGSSGVPAQARARGRGHCTPLVTHPSGVQGYMTDGVSVHTCTYTFVPIHTERTVLHPQRAVVLVGLLARRVSSAGLLTRCSVCSAHTYWRGQGEYANVRPGTVLHEFDRTVRAAGVYVKG